MNRCFNPRVPLCPVGTIGSLGVWAASLMSFYLFFTLNFFVNMQFRISFVYIQFLLFLDIWIKSYGEMKILGEVWRGWASARANHHDLTKYAQKSG
jgi:hypothetical protein